MRLLVGDDWAEDHHDVEVMNEAGKVLAKRREECLKPVDVPGRGCTFPDHP